MNHRFSLIHSVPGVLGGKPVFRDTRIGVDMVLEMLSNGRSVEQILMDYPVLTKEHLSQAFGYGTSLIRNEELIYA